MSDKNDNANNSTTSTSTPIKVKAKRKRFTFDDKLEIARKALVRGTSIASVARAEGLNESTVRGWVKTIAELEAAVENDNDVRKARHLDKTPSLTNALKLFCEQQKQYRPGTNDTKEEVVHQPLTIDCISSKATALSKQLLLEYEQNPDTSTITPQEATVLRNHRFSSSWAHKWLQRNRNFRKSSSNNTITTTPTADTTDTSTTAAAAVKNEAVEDVATTDNTPQLSKEIKSEQSTEENKLMLVQTINALYQTVKLEQELNVDTSDTWEEIKLAKARLKNHPSQS
jgi:transposase-like protein